MAWLPHMFQSTRPRGARRDRRTIYYAYKNVSIHAPTRGATSSVVYITAAGVFQSTRPRGARLGKHVDRAGPDSFNPRAHAGRDLLNTTGTFEVEVFQSTRPRGARPIVCRADP